MIVQSTAVTRVGHVKSNVTDKLHVPHATNPKETVSTPSPDNEMPKSQIENSTKDLPPDISNREKDLGSRRQERAPPGRNHQL